MYLPSNMEGTLSLAMSWGKVFINRSASAKSFQMQQKLVDLQRHTENDRSHYVPFSRFYWHFGANLVVHICSMLQVCIIAIWSQGLILNLGRSYTTFGTKIPVFRANSGCLLGTKWQKWWIYKNVSRIVKIVHSAQAHPIC